MRTPKIITPKTSIKSFKTYFLSLFVILSTNSYAKSYELNFLVDNNSQKYLKEIKDETKALFSSDDKINFKIDICKDSCKTKIKNYDFSLFQEQKKLQNYSNSLITYNEIYSTYDESKLVRASALIIFEYLKENKKNRYLHLENQFLEEKKEEIKSENSIDLKDLFSLAKENNLQILQTLNSMKLSKLDVLESKTKYKPQVDFYSNVIQIDADRAKYSNGLYSEGTVDIGVKLTQLIYSDKVIKNIKIKKLLEKSNKSGVKAKIDEVFYSVILTYLNIIKASNHNDIMKIKQNFIKQNLNFAKQRVEIGVQNRSDIYRWESELANVNIELANSINQLDSLKIELANLLQIDKKFSFLNYGMESEIFKLFNQDSINYISDEKVQNLFLDEIIYSHSTLKQLHELIVAKNEEYKMNKSSRYLPTIAFEADAKKIVDRYAQGSNIARSVDDEEYQAVINLTLPIYEGGLKSVNIEKNEIELLNLKLQYNEVKNIIEKNVEQNYDSLKKSYEKISFSKTAQEFALKNFELIQDRYKIGSENIISLLDAQNAYIVSKLNENISIIDYLIDLSSIYYFSGNIDILVDMDKKDNLEKKILKVTKGL